MPPAHPLFGFRRGNQRCILEKSPLIYRNLLDCDIEDDVSVKPLVFFKQLKKDIVGILV